MRLGLLLLLLFTCISQLHAKKPSNRLSAFPFPVIYYAPETRFVGGIAGVGTFRFKRDSIESRPSSTTIGLAYTQNRQLLLYSTFSLFYDHERWYAYGEAGYYKYSYKFFGVGQRETPEVIYGVDYPRIKINVAHHVHSHMYAGLGYQFENYALKDTATSGPLADQSIPGIRGSRSSGLGPQVIYDSRDTVLFPSRGVYGIISWMNNGALWGGDHNFNRFVLDVSYYYKIHAKAILALNSYLSMVTGDAPFQQQSLLGGNKRMRGYYEGRYIDKNLAVLQAELRFPIYGRFGGVAFGDAGALGNEQQLFRLEDIKYSYGAGIRFNVIRKDHLNLRLDYAIAQGSSGVYFTVGEAF